MPRSIYSLLILFYLALSESAFSQTPVQPSGSGTVGDPYQVSSLSNLAWIQDAANDTAWNSYYVQTANIDASSDSTWNSGAGFSPIGTYPGAYFGGTYDGGGHTITGLYISQGSNDYIGLFGYTQGATISNLGLLNLNIIGGTAVGGIGGEFFQNTTVRNCYTTGNISGSTYVGGLIGWVETSCTVTGSYSTANVSASSGTFGGLIGWNDLSSIDSCYSTGNITGTGSSNGGAGGLIGSNSSSNVSHSHTTSSVTAPGSGTSYVGGFVGSNNQNDTISGCYSSGTVTCIGSIIGGFFGYDVSSTTTNSYTTSTLICDPSTNWVGGFAGEISGSADSNCYSTGSLTGALFVGGFAGEAFNGAVINKCYSVGHVIGSALTGGFVGYVSGASTDSCFWDTDSSGWTTSAGGEGLTDAEMKIASTFTGALWDFTGTWAINGSINNGYPYLMNTTDISLPVQATDFLAAAAVGSITLSWRTQSEVNNVGFNILREDPGMSSFKILASYASNDGLKGLGTSSTGRAYDFTDNKVTSGKTYRYKIQSVSTSSITKDLSILTVVTDVPQSYELYQNYPNPFNPSTTIRFDLKETSTVTLDIYNVLGQRVLEQDYATMNAGRYDEVVNMDRFASGVYFYRIAAAGNDGQKFVSIKKLVLMK